MAACGSWVSGGLDAHSDLDLVVAAIPASYESLMRDRLGVAGKLGPLLAAFSGEHVGEPRLLICLYADPLLHVDLKFVSLGDAARDADELAVLWERAGELSARLTGPRPERPGPDFQWIEDRFWVWVHYAASKLARGELFEVVGFLAFLRARVLGPLASLRHGKRSRGVRRLETLAPRDLPELRATVARHDRPSCAAAIRSAAALYRSLREELAPPALLRRDRAEKAALEYLERTISENGRG